MPSDICLLRSCLTRSEQTINILQNAPHKLYVINSAAATAQLARSVSGVLVKVQNPEHRPGNNTPAWRRLAPFISKASKHSERRYKQDCIRPTQNTNLINSAQVTAKLDCSVSTRTCGDRLPRCLSRKTHNCSSEAGPLGAETHLWRS